ncbi:NPCBM/NEW2 domain-containing protein [Nocardiopsis sp. RSe5-2]|uniref:non-specific serine/threonine protein kinase n=1 Tax=Nocardiopsis endophytica TaxID=3018445 RepID=A0ABT4U893_9ACTN|nr:NPCBM/NEW2 domain-containing protein [Nocardiopsis endophytica]MDA2812946.1 NPCBM/NEW2 domain-containing protein [Nocardiopsis endophytica]
MSTDLFVGPDHQPDKYRLVRQVGRGGEGTLHLAEVVLAGHTEPVIVKALHAEIAADERQFADLSARWGEQAELLRFINHPGVVGIRENFEGAREHPPGAANPADRSLFLVMNYVDGVPLRDWRAEHAVDGPEAADALLAGLEGVGDTIDHLHSGRATPSGRPVVHGDLSPGNLMFGGDGSITLVDFGLSRISARHVTRTPWFTPGYAAPEVFIGEYSAATDRYAFGAIVFFALTGQDPYPAPEQMREAFRGLPMLAGADPSAVERALAVFSVEPEDRPSAAEWVRGLRALITGAGGPAYTPAPPAADPRAEPTVPDERRGGGRPRGRDARPRRQAKAASGGVPGPHAAQGHGGPQASANTAGKKGAGRRVALVAGVAALVLLLMAGAGTAGWMLYDRMSGTEVQAGGDPSAAGGGRQDDARSGRESPSPKPSASASTSASPSAGDDKDDKGDGKDRVNSRPGESLSARSTILPASAYSSGSADLDEVRYKESLLVSGRCGASVAEYNLGRGSSAFAATVGVADGASGAGTARFTVTGDGERLASATAGPGEPAELNADVSGVLRLRLTVKWSGDCGGSTAVWGDPKLT